MGLNSYLGNVVEREEFTVTFSSRQLPSAVDVWNIPLVATFAELAQLSSLLSPDERSRASRFYFARDQRRFIVARGRLRQVLARYLNQAAEEIRFTYGPQGKPTLGKNSSHIELHFNLSHCEDRALIAVSRGCVVGIDLERMRAELAMQDIADHYFSSSEREDLSKLPSTLWAAGFFKCWTCKEAYLKGIGDGLTLPLNAFDVTVDPRQPAGLLRGLGNGQGSSAWSIYDVNAGEGFVGALALWVPASSIQMMS